MARTLPRSRLWLVALLGATAGSVCDRIHIVGGVLRYRSPDILGQAWWVPPLFAAAAVCLCVGHHKVHPQAPRLTPIQAMQRTMLFVVAYGATGLNLASPRALAAALIVGFAVWALARREARRFYLYAVTVALVGTTFEALLAATGAFTYASPDFLNIPSWLPGLYLWAAVFGSGIDRATRSWVTASQES